jgi:hypothetical protein
MNVSDKLRSLTYSLDIQMVGVYFWCGNFVIQFGGTEVDDEPFYYPFVVPTFIGFGFVLPNYFSWHTPFDKFKRIEQKVNNVAEGFESRAVK